MISILSKAKEFLKLLSQTEVSERDEFIDGYQKRHKLSDEQMVALLALSIT